MTGIAVPGRPPVTVRRAGHDDWDRIWPIWHEIVAAGDTYTYDPSTSSAAARQGWLGPHPDHAHSAELARAGDEAWVAVDGEQVLGTYHLAPNHAGPGAHVANASYMVGAAGRGLGVGRTLVEHSIERARAAGYLGLQFNAVAASNVHAIRLYEQLGFVTIGIVPKAFRHPVQGLVGLHVMYRDL